MPLPPERIAELRRRAEAEINTCKRYEIRAMTCLGSEELLALLAECERVSKMRQAVVQLHEQATALANAQRGKDDWLCRQHEDEASCYYRAIAAIDEALSPPEQAGAQP